MSDIFKVLGWRKDKAVFEVELLNNASVDVEDIQGICSLFNTSPYNDNCSGCQFVLSFVIKQDDVVFYHPYLEDQENYWVEMDFDYCSSGVYEGEILKGFKQKDWELP